MKSKDKINTIVADDATLGDTNGADQSITTMELQQPPSATRVANSVDISAAKLQVTSYISDIILQCGININCAYRSENLISSKSR